MNLPYSGKLTKNEYLAVWKLNNRGVLKKGGFHIDFWVLLSGIGVLFFVFGIVTIRQMAFPWYVIEFIIGILLIGFGLKTRALPSKFWDENHDRISRMEGSISDETIELVTPNGNFRINWSELDGYGEYQGIVVLYKPPVAALPFIDRFFERQEDWQAFKQMVTNRLPLSHRVDKFQFQIPQKESLPVYILFIISIIIMIVYYFLHGS